MSVTALDGLRVSRSPRVFRLLPIAAASSSRSRDASLPASLDGHLLSTACQHAEARPRVRARCTSCAAPRYQERDMNAHRRLSSKVPHLARHKHACRAHARRDRTSISWWLPYPRRRRAVLQGMRGACISQPRNTCLGCRSRAQHLGMLSGWLALGGCHLWVPFGERQGSVVYAVAWA